MTDREKIIEIIKKNGTYNGKSLSFDYYVIQDEDLADALIAAGYGDVKEWKRRAEVAEKERDGHRKYNRILLKGIEIVMRNIMCYCNTELPSILLQAEREIEEEERK